MFAIIICNNHVICFFVFKCTFASFEFNVRHGYLFIYFVIHVYSVLCIFFFYAIVTAFL